MRTGNTTEREAPWKLEFRFDRFIPPKWNRPYLVWTHILLKLFSWLAMAFGTPGMGYIENGEGYLTGNLKAEIKAVFFTFLALLDFFITKNVMGPKLTGLHHGFKINEENKITYHYYAEKDFLTRYPITDRDTFFTFLVFPSIAWLLTTILLVATWNKILIPFSVLGFASVYLNLYLFVQVRYYRQWSMAKFFAFWLYNFYMRIEFLEGDSSDNGFRNSYNNRARY